MHYKGALKAANTEALEKGKDKWKPHFLVKNHGCPPSKLPAGQTRQEKVRSIEILKHFFKNEYRYSLGFFVDNYKNGCRQLKSGAAAEGIIMDHVKARMSPVNVLRHHMYNWKGKDGGGGGGDCKSFPLGSLQLFHLNSFRMDESYDES